MSEITLLHPQAKPPRPEVVEMASKLMNDIAAGKIDGVAMVTLDRDGGITTYISPSEDYFRVLGALERLKHRMNIAADASNHAKK